MRMGWGILSSPKRRKALHAWSAMEKAHLLVRSILHRRLPARSFLRQRYFRGAGGDAAGRARLGAVISSCTPQA